MNEIEKKQGTQDILIPQNSELQKDFFESVEMVDDIVLKKYLSHLNEYPVVSMKENTMIIDIDQDIRLFKIDEMVYEKDGFSSDKFATLFSTFSNKKHSFFLLLDSDGKDLDIYFGVNTNGDNISSTTVKTGFESTLKSQFPGVKTSNVDISGIKDMSLKVEEYKHVSSYSGIAYDRIDDPQEFIQGLEKLLMTMDGKKYTSMVIATPLLKSELENNKKYLESIYSNLSAYKTSQIGYTLTNSKNKGTTKTVGVSSGKNESSTKGTSNSEGISTTDGISNSEGTTETRGSTQSNMFGQALSLVGDSLITGLAIGGTVATGGIAAPIAIAAVGARTSGAILSSRTTNKSKATTTNTTTSSSESKSFTSTSNESDTVGTNYSETSSESENIGITLGDSQSLTLNRDNKEIINILENIDIQLERQKTFDNTGAFGCTAYFLSDSAYEAEFAASSYQALVSGEKTTTETTAVNIWRQGDAGTGEIKKYLQFFTHPVFEYNKFSNQYDPIYLTPMSVVSGRELSIHMGLPRKSVLNFPVVEHATFGTSVLKYNQSNDHQETLPLGTIYHLGESKLQKVKLDIESLSMHTFITGSTGSGKSNTTYLILEKILSKNVNFLVIEPAKGEYKHILGNREDVSVYGTNSQHTDLLKINPFYFPRGVHVLEHIDRLVEIFNVCWPMYAAMPAILKDSILNAYTSVGWDLTTSMSNYEDILYPNFFDLETELENVINQSSYSADTKGDYIGALVTRVHSLSTGLNQFIFTNNDLSDKELFDKNVIVDLSRVGSSETKSLIMGLLVMRLNEYRMSQAQQLGVMNQKLKHITVIEEAHNLLKRTSQDQSNESSNLVGKSVEMLSNSIAEMRTYGEGFIIVDQSPTSVDLSAIKNTNTKIIMKTPEFSDRELVGKSVGLNDEQIEEIIKLPKGVGVVFQNDWVEPVLCFMSKARSEEDMFNYHVVPLLSEQEATKNVIGFLLKLEVPEEGLLKASIDYLKISSITNRLLKNLVIKKNKLTVEEEAVVFNEIIDISPKNIYALTENCRTETELYSNLCVLVQNRIPYISEINCKYISLSIIRYYAKTDLLFHKIYQLLIEEGN